MDPSNIGCALNYSNSTSTGNLQITLRVQELPGGLGRYGRRWIISVPADACLEERAGLCPRVLVSADDSLFVSEFETTPTATSTADEVLRAELVSQGGALSGTGAQVTSSRWIEGWRGFEQQVVSVGATGGSLSGTFRLLYEDQATVPLAVNASAEAVEVSVERYLVLLELPDLRTAEFAALAGRADQHDRHPSSAFPVHAK